MQIQVKCKCGDGECQEWAIIELQGVVEAQPSVANQLQNLEIGRLCRCSSEAQPSVENQLQKLEIGRLCHCSSEPPPSVANQRQNLEIGRLCRCSSEEYTFTVGYHELSGSKVPLKKPMLVLKKNRVSGPDPAASPPATELEVVGIIRHRILFKTRPKALITRPQK